jgi:small GTP-binding protein
MREDLLKGFTHAYTKFKRRRTSKTRTFHINELLISLVKFSASEDDQNTLKESLEQLDEFFLLVIVGEFNSGKSALINAFLGEEILKEGVTPTTMQINMLRYGKERERTVINENLHIITAPIDVLNEISIVDTPGTNAVIREHEIITNRFVPRADLVLFITSVDRPFTESERVFLEQIRDWGKKIIIVLNKIDILQDEKELTEIQKFISDKANTLLGITPEICPVSARLALQAKRGNPEFWQKSRFEALENYIRHTLDERNRIMLKFLNPIGVGLHLNQRYLNIIEQRLAILKDDFAMLSSIEEQLNLYKEDMQRDFRLRIADIENILYEVEQQGQDYFDETIRLSRIFDLLDKDRVKSGFEQKVMGDVSTRIDTKINELIDWIVDSNFRQWQAVTEHIAERRREHKNQLIGDIGSFSYDRERIMEGVGRETQRVVESFDKQSEAEALAESTRNTVAAVAAIEIGAVGLGAAITAAATTAAADFTGILFASVIAALGLFIIPAKRQQAKQELRQKMSDMRTQLALSLTTHFERELERSLQRINDAIAPYTRFIRAEGEKSKQSKIELTNIKAKLEGLKLRINEYYNR